MPYDPKPKDVGKLDVFVLWALTLAAFAWIVWRIGKLGLEE